MIRKKRNIKSIRKKKKHKKEKKDKKGKKELARSETISLRDYYNKAAEFREWLLERKGLYLVDVETDIAKQHFAKFVELWNNKELPSKYYKGIAPELQEAGTRTKYQWGFAKKLDPVEMGTLRESIWEETNKLPPGQNINEPSKKVISEDRDIGPVVGPPKPMEELDAEEKEVLEIYLRKSDRKKYKKKKKIQWKKNWYQKKLEEMP